MVEQNTTLYANWGQSDEPEDPKDPEDPGSPVDPRSPEEPTTPGNPQATSLSTAARNAKSLSKTGDTELFAVLAVGAFASSLLAVAALRRRRTTKE